MGERRRRQEPFNGTEKRRTPFNYEEERQRFILWRERIILGIGGTGLFLTLAAAALLDLEDPTILVTSFSTFGGLLITPLILRRDEGR